MISDYDSPAAFAARISALLDDAGGRVAIGRRARQAAEARFGWARVASEIRSLYSELLAAPRTRPLDPTAARNTRASVR